MNRPSKRNKKVLNLVEKIKILDALKEGEKVAFLARRFNVNESTIRSIRNNESKIRESAKSLGKHAENCKISRSPLMEKMEDMLIIWLQDLMHKKIPIGGDIIREQAKQEGSGFDPMPFHKTERFYM
uniref:HTH psq-type domain-containing protein n=1 Tax=Trichogramma kaykai TaxID=54128 RepID=A0ABD2XK06_9HYME